MIQINKQGNAIVIEFTDNDKYLFNGTIEIAPNELMVVVDDSNMATFKRVSNGDTLFSQIVDKIQINGTTASKDTVIDLFGSIGYSSGGGGGTGAVSSVNGQTGDVVITAAGIGAITKNQADNIYQVKGDYALKSDIPSTEDLATKEELNEKQEVFQVNAPMAFERDEATQDLHLSINLGDYAKKTDLNSKADSSTVEALSTEIATVSTNVSNLTSKVNEDSDKIASLDTEMGNKQDTLVSGTNIKTINNQSILGEGNIEIQGGGTITVDSELSDTSVNPVLNKVINAALGTKANTTDVYTKTEVNTKLDGKVDKVENKSLVSDTEITKLAGLKSQTEIDNSIADAKKAGTDALTNLTNHINNTENPHQVTKEQVGLDNVDNTSDADKPISTAVLNALNDKANSSDLEAKQDTLVSGTNIKTINGDSILGEGDLPVGGKTYNFNYSGNFFGADNKDVRVTIEGLKSNEYNIGDILIFYSSGSYYKPRLVIIGKDIHSSSTDYFLGSIQPLVNCYKFSTLNNVLYKVYSFEYSYDEDSRAIELGKNVSTDGETGIAIGNNISSSGVESIGIGYNLNVYPGATIIGTPENSLPIYDTTLAISANQVEMNYDPETMEPSYTITPYTYIQVGTGEKYVKLFNPEKNTLERAITTSMLKTINGQSIIGEGNIEVKATVDSELSTESENPVQNKIITAALNGKQAAGDYALKSEIPDVSGLATKTELNNVSSEIEHKADKTSVYTMDEVNTKLATKQATLVAGTNITLSDPDTEGKVTISATLPDISGITTTVEELTGEVAALSTDKQDKLVSGTNIKTINGETILGTGDINTDKIYLVFEFVNVDHTSGMSDNRKVYDLIKSGTYPRIYITKDNLKLFVSNILVLTSSITLYFPLASLSYAFAYLPIDSYGQSDMLKNLSFNFLSGITGNYITKDYNGVIQITQKDLETATAKGQGVADAYDVKQYIASHGGSGGTVDTAMSDTSENAVQNKVIKAYIDSLVGEILSRLQNINGDTTGGGTTPDSGGGTNNDGPSDAGGGDVVTPGGFD